MNGARPKSSALSGWGSGDQMRAVLDMAMFDAMPPEIRTAVAGSVMYLPSGAIADEWASARLRGITAAEFAALIPQSELP